MTSAPLQKGAFSCVSLPHPGDLSQVRDRFVAGGLAYRRRSGAETSQVARCTVAGLQKTTDLRRYLFPVADSCCGSGIEMSQVVGRSVAGLQKTTDLRRYLPPVANLRRSLAEKRKPATIHAMTCDNLLLDLRRATLTCDGICLPWPICVAVRPKNANLRRFMP